MMTGSTSELLSGARTNIVAVGQEQRTRTSDDYGLTPAIYVR